MTRRIGGSHTAQQLAELFGDRPGAARQHARPHDLALQDALDHVRRAASALRAIEHPNAQKHLEIAQAHAQLVDVREQLEAAARPA